MTAPEKELLTDLCVKFSNVTECKKTHGATRLSKAAAWDQLCEEFNAVSREGPRTVSQLKYVRIRLVNFSASFYFIGTILSVISSWFIALMH